MVEEDARTGSGRKLLVRAPFTIAGQNYVADAYQGNHPSLDPTDVLVAEQKTGNIDLIVIQKGIAPPPILKALITPPVQFVNTNDTVNLDGTHSIGKIVSYKWAQVSGPAIVIQNGTLSIAKFTEPNTLEDIVVSLTVADANTHTDTATATIKVQVVPPVGMITTQDVSVTTGENTPVTVELTGQDTNQGATSITLGIATPPAHGTANIVITTGATTPITGSVNAVYKPATGFTGTDTFTYTASDNLGNVSKPGTVTITVGSSPPPPPDVDKFGVKKIYGDGPGSNYFMSADPNSDPRGNNPEASSSYKPKFISNPDGSFKIKGQLEIRGAITQDNGYHENQLCTDFVKCTQQGFMQDSKDFKDIEMTSYYRINQAGSGTSNGEAHIEHVMRGQRSTTSNSPVGVCGKALGCSDNYHGNIYCNKGTDGPARQKYEVDRFHTTGYGQDINGVNNNTAYNFKKGQWFGIKTIVYNMPDGSVQLEHWTDENNTNTWKKTHSFNDHGQWPSRGAIGNCNVPKSPPPPITFGGPLTVFRSDNLQDYDVKWQSIRSIDSTKKLMGSEHNRDVTTNDEGNPDDVILKRVIFLDGHEEIHVD